VGRAPVVQATFRCEGCPGFNMDGACVGSCLTVMALTFFDTYPADILHPLAP
jgi:hypothetical protein